MPKKTVSAIMSAIFFAVTMTGCGSQVAAPAATEVTEASGVEEGLPSGDVTLRVWGSEEDEELVKQISDSFIAAHKGEANITIVYEAHSEANCKDDILGDVLNAADVFTFADDQLMALVASGVLKEVENSTEIAGRNLEASVSAASLNGKLYAYPLTADNGYFLYYNKAYLSDSDVETMDGILQVAEATGKQVFMEMTSGWYMYAFFGNTDMEIGLNDDGISTYCNWNAKYTNTKGVDVAQGMLDIAASPAFTANGEKNLASGAADDSYIAGVSGIWDETAIKDAWGDNYAAAKLPTYTVNGSQLQMSSYAGYKLVGVNSRSANAKWAALFADWMTNEENQTLRFNLRGQGPSNTAASASGAIGESKAIQALQQQAPYSSLQRVGGTYWDASSAFGTAISQHNPTGADLQTLLNDMVTGITGEESTGDAVAEETTTEEATTEEATTEETVVEETTETESKEE